jgi:hypothetical protein
MITTLPKNSKTITSSTTPINDFLSCDQQHTVPSQKQSMIAGSNAANPTLNNRVREKLCPHRGFVVDSVDLGGFGIGSCFCFSSPLKRVSSLDRDLILDFNLRLFDLHAFILAIYRGVFFGVSIFTLDIAGVSRCICTVGIRSHHDINVYRGPSDSYIQSSVHEAQQCFSRG